MKTMLGRRRCRICTKWLPIEHDSNFCSPECERTYIQEKKFWGSYKEENRQAAIKYRKDERNENNKCLNCGDPIMQKDNGRFRSYCGNDCKQEAYRKRRKLQKAEKENDNNNKDIKPT